MFVCNNSLLTFLRQVHLYQRVIYGGVIFDLLKSLDFDHGTKTFKCKFNYIAASPFLMYVVVIRGQVETWQ